MIYSCTCTCTANLTQWNFKKVAINNIIVVLGLLDVSFACSLKSEIVRIEGLETSWCLCLFQPLEFHVV